MRTHSSNRQASAEGVQRRLTEDQRNVVAANRAILLTHMNKDSDARALATELAQKHPAMLSPTLTLAALDHKAGDFAAALERLDTHAAKNPDNADSCALLKAQMLLEAGMQHGVCVCEAQQTNKQANMTPHTTLHINPRTTDGCRRCARVCLQHPAPAWHSRHAGVPAHGVWRDSGSCGHL